MCGTFAKVPGYSAKVRENLIWANQHSELIVRHLLMPGHVECCWLAGRAMAGGKPSGCENKFRFRFLAGLARFGPPRIAPEPIGVDETARAQEIARACRLNTIT